MWKFLKGSRSDVTERGEPVPSDTSAAERLECDNPLSDHGFVIACQTIQQVIACCLDLAALGARHGRPVYPALVSSNPETGLAGPMGLRLPCVPHAATEWTDRTDGLPITELIALCQERSDAHSKSVCVIVGQSCVAALGAGYGLSSGKRVVTCQDLDELLALQPSDWNARSVTLVMPRDLLARAGLSAVHELFDESLGSAPTRSSMRRVPWGLLCATSDLTLSQLIARIALRRTPEAPRGVLFDHIGTGQVTSHDGPEFEVVGPPDSLHASRRLVQETWDFAAFRGHGRNYCGMAGNLCTGTPSGEGQPECVDGHSCRYDDPTDDSTWRRIPADRLNLDVVFLESCLSANVLTAPQPPAPSTLSPNIALSLLAGQATAVLSPYRAVRDMPEAAPLAWALAERGTPLGTLCATLNAAFWTDLETPAPFILLGDPESRLAAPSSEPPSEQPAERVDEKTWAVRLPPTERFAQSAVVQDQDLAQARTEGPLHCLLDSSGAVACLPGERPDQVTLYRLGGAGGHRPTCTLTTADPLASGLLTAARSLLETLDDWGLYELLDLCTLGTGTAPLPPTSGGLSALGGLGDLLHSVERNLAGLTGQPLHALDDYQRLQQLSASLAQACQQESSQALRLVLEQASDYAAWPVDLMGRLRGVGIRDTVISAPCPSCGSAVTRKHYEVGLGRGHIRSLDECERCEQFSDTPGDGAALHVAGPEIISRGERVSYSLHLVNPEPWPAFTSVALSVDRRGIGHGEFRIDPADAEAVLAPGSEQTFTFSLQPSRDVRPHTYRVKIWVLMNGRLSMTGSMVQIRG